MGGYGVYQDLVEIPYNGRDSLEQKTTMNRRTKVIVAVLSVWLVSAFLYGFFNHDQMHPPSGPANSNLTLTGCAVGLGFLVLLWVIRKRQK